MNYLNEGNLRFKDLPDDLKSKLIHLQKLSTQNTQIKFDTRIDTYDELIVKIGALPVNALKKNMTIISDQLEDFRNGIFYDENTLLNIENALLELEFKIMSYSEAIKYPEFLMDLRDVYATLSGKFINLRNKYNIM
ncbi:hypothetical protein EDEG_01399 [Edhazardia aedis USNM 41457]|uniref:Uncharacterized protein n=1 Tax=Edhazardia aedis (strain USNM 41457) TaxID=1003232 RepID=J8ZXD0_EDHAE|nr:hypothetical protein EDEG_01399 [Edhazardia aedis USNM 41457]|eukprot:EJW04343.1 hypothetical protein EDEG_01399 [Edhazardia aedis USNM 41457]